MLIRKDYPPMTACTGIRFLRFYLAIAAIGFHAEICVAQAVPGPLLPGTKPWTMPADPAAEMVEGIHRHLDKMLAESVKIRDAAWQKAQADPQFQADRRDRLRRSLGFAGGEKIAVPKGRFEIVTPGPGPIGLPAPKSGSKKARIDTVRWEVFPDVWMEGHLVRPIRQEDGEASGTVRFLGIVLENGTEDKQAEDGLRMAVSLAEAGGLILVPAMLDRKDTWSGDPKVRFTNLSHREWIWRMAWETGQTPLAYEISGVVSGLHHLRTALATRQFLPSLVYGHGDGGQVALLAANLGADASIVWISGYFQARDTTQWLEPIDRTIWRQALEFQDAELAAMVVENPDTRLIIDRTDGPTMAESLPPRNGRDDAADGALRPATKNEIDRELTRARHLAGTSAERILEGGDRSASMSKVADLLGLSISQRADDAPMGIAESAKVNAIRSNFRTWDDFTQNLLRTSELRRFDLWKAADPQKPEAFGAERDRLRNVFWNDLMGKMPEPTEPLSAESKLVYDEPGFRGYAVKIPVYADVFAYGVLLLPKDIKPGEKRPVVVCQHGLEGRPDDIVDPKKKTVYHAYGAALADRGYIVFAPQNPYIGKERFRTIQRKAWPLGQSLFAVIIRQHERILDWLETQDNVDKNRIAFYGLSYGGKSAMRIPAALTRYCLSICSADFNEWVVKCTNTDRQYSYLFTIEYDMYEWDLASKFNYAEMAALIAPRPFMVERGHFDGVAPDEWIGYEFAKLKRTYDLLGVGENAQIAYFNRGHEIDGTATFEFLAKHLNWPRGAIHLVRPK